MDRWFLYGKSGNPSYDITKSWLTNHGIPFEGKSIYQITTEEIKALAKLVPGGAKALVYPNTFSYSLMNPQRSKEQNILEEIHNGDLPEEEIINHLTLNPFLMVTPILTNLDKVIIGYQYDTMVSTFRFVKVKDVTMA